MKISQNRILTTHAGRLERPDEITEQMERHPLGRPQNEGFNRQLESAVLQVVDDQARAGIDIVNDGEFGRLSWNIYLNGRLGGHEIVPFSKMPPRVRKTRDRRDFAEFYRILDGADTNRYFKNPGRAAPAGHRWACVGPVTYRGQLDLEQELSNLRTAVAAAGAADAFVTSTSPVRPDVNAFYRDEHDYYVAVGEAMRVEYQAIIDAGFVLQIDDPHLPDLWDRSETEPTLKEYRLQAAQHVELVNHALRGLPADRIRYHICWGSWHGPHVHDVPFVDIVDIMLRVNAQAYAFEAANARHEHEWQVWQEVKLPDDKILIPGVVAHSTDIIEHPDLVSLRIRNFAGLVGRERVIAGTDCGMGYRVHTSIAWAKLRALADGAARASAILWQSR